jgi:hypothetical protein
MEPYCEELVAGLHEQRGEDWARNVEPKIQATRI